MPAAPRPIAIRRVEGQVRQGLGIHLRPTPPGTWDLGPILTNPNGAAKTAAALTTLRCGQERQLVDQNLTTRLRNQCPNFNSVNVDFAFNTAIRNMIGSNVRERGIDRWYNGVKQSRLAQHRSQPSGYRWHGVLSAAKAPMTIKIDDSLNFSVVTKKKV